MPHRKVRDKKRYPDSAEAAARRRQKAIEKLDARYENDPAAEACRICGVKRSIIGMATHMRAEHQSYVYVCSCGQGFNKEKCFEAHRCECDDGTPELKTRRLRYAFVDSIVHLPYREFVKELLRGH
jgi:hypothetical protein